MEFFYFLGCIILILGIGSYFTNNGFESTLEVMKLFKFHIKGGGKPSEKEKEVSEN